MDDNNLSKLTQEKIKYLIKGLRYSLGYSLCDIDKVGLATGLVGNWECGLCLPNKKNLEIVGDLIKKSGKNYEELIEIGKLNFGSLLESMAEKLGISKQILIRFVISKYTHICDINKFDKLKEGKVDIAPKTKLALLQLKEKVRGNNKDARQVVFQLQKEATFSNVDNLGVLILVTEYLKSQKRLLYESNLNYTDGSSSDWLHGRAKVPDTVLSQIQATYPDLLVKIKEKIKNEDSIIHQQWRRAENYPEIVDFQYRNEVFENQVFELFGDICNNLVRNVLVTDKDFGYVTEVDLIGDYKGKKIYFMCKGRNKHQIINDRRTIKKSIDLIQDYLKPDIILLLVSCIYPYDKEYFEDDGIFFIDKNDLDKIRKTKDISYIYLKKNQKKIYDNIHDLEAFRINNKLSKIQFEALLDCSSYLYRRLKKDNSISMKNKNSLTRLTKISGIRELHFKANMNLAFKSEKALFLKYVRKYLGISLIELSEKIDYGKEYIQNLETGRKTSKFLENKIENYLKTFKDFNTLKQKAIKFIQLQKEIWEKARLFNKIINFKGEPVDGNKLESDVSSILSSRGYLVFKNVILANEDLAFKKEVDIYAIKDSREVIIECTESRNSIKWENKGELLSEMSNELKCDVILVSKRTSDFGKKVLKTKGVMNVEVEELERYL